MNAKFRKYNKKIWTILTGGNLTIIPQIETMLPTLDNQNLCINEMIKYVLSKNISSDIKNAYIYYILYIDKCQGTTNFSSCLKNIDMFEHINVTFSKNIHFYCENQIILLDSDQLEHKINNSIALIGCGHNNIINLEKLKGGDTIVKNYYINHSHNNIFTIDIGLCKYPDLCFNVENTNLDKTHIVQKLKNKFKILICEGFDINQNMVRNLSFFLEHGGIIISLYDSGAPLDSDEYTVENLKYTYYKILNGNNEIYSLDEILNYYYPLDNEKLLQLMFENKVNIY